MSLHLNLWTQILRARLANTNRIDIVVIEETIIEQTSNLNDHCGRILAYFCVQRDTLPCLLAFAREKADGDFTHAFCFYVNTKYRAIQKAEHRRFKSKLANSVRLGVVNAVTELPMICSGSILVQMAEFMLSLDLVTDYMPRKQVEGVVYSSMVCFNPYISFPKCDTSLLTPEASSVWRIIRRSNIKIVNFDYDDQPERIDRQFGLLRINYQGHVIFGINHRLERILMFLLTHPSQFRCTEDANDLMLGIQFRLPDYKIKHFLAARFYGKTGTACNSYDVMRALYLCITTPLLTIKQCDIESIVTGENIKVLSDRLPSSQPTPSKQDHVDPSRPSTSNTYSELANREPEYISIDTEEPEYVNVNVEEPDYANINAFSGMVTIDLDHEHCEPIAICSVTSSQRTIIISQRELDAELSTLNRRNSAKTLLELPYPSVNAVEPRDDPSNVILKDHDFVKDEIKLMIIDYALPACLILEVQTNSVVKHLNNQFEVPSRLLIIPFGNDSELFLIIIDKQTEEWALLDPHLESQRNCLVFNDIKARLSRPSSLYKDYAGRQITLPCHFHTDYTTIHLLMGVYCVAKAFRYASMLPIRCYYTEKQLRGFCHQICKERQIRNSQYNRENGFVKPNGFLTASAYRALPSPVSFQRSVVAADACMFCGKRFHKNLGSHMIMAHGGQGKTKLQRRRWLETL